MNIQYHAIRVLLHDKPFLVPLAKPKHVLDVGTGTGIWAIDVGMFPFSSLPHSCEENTYIAPFPPLSSAPRMQWADGELRRPVP